MLMYCIEYQCLKETQHDSFHVRCQIRPRFHEPKDLEIKRGDILHVTNSREDDNSYLAWKVNSDGTEVERGTIPNAARYGRLGCMVFDALVMVWMVC